MKGEYLVPLKQDIRGRHTLIGSSDKEIQIKNQKKYLSGLLASLSSNQEHKHNTNSGLPKVTYLICLPLL